MFRPADIVTEALLDRLGHAFTEMFPGAPPQERHALLRAARVGLTFSSLTDAVYHNLDHTVQVVCVGLDMLRGKVVRDGNVRSIEAVHFLASLCLFSVGFNRRLLAGDDGSCCVVADGASITLPPGATDAYLWPHYADRGMLFARRHFHGDPVLDGEMLAAILDYARFPPPLDRLPETDSYPGLLRAAHLIGAVADPYFFHKLKPLTLEMEESGILGLLGFKDVVEFRANYTELFWTTLAPVIRDGAALLEYTTPGRLWLSSMRSHLLREEHVLTVA